MTALRADSLRCSGVIADALASPPLRPPFLPSLERYSRNSADGLFPMSRVYTKTAFVVKRRFSLTCVDGLWIVVDMNTLPKDKQAVIIRAHVEGNSIRSMERMTGVHRDTIMR